MKKVLLLSLSLNILLIGTAGYKWLLHLYSKREKKTPHQIDLDYYHTKTSVFQILPRDSHDIVFLGSSLIDFCPWHEIFDNLNIKNRGIGGDFIAGVNKRLDDVYTIPPQQIFLMIGINDLGAGRSTNNIIKDYESLLQNMMKRSSRTEIIILSILPTDNRSNLQNQAILELNQNIKKIANRYQLDYIDLYSKLCTEDQRLNPDYTFDGLHLNGKGYLVWKQAIEREVKNEE